MAQSSVQLIVDAGGALNPIRQVQRASQALSTQFERLKGSAANAARGAVDLGRTLEQNTRKLREQTTSVQGLIGAYAGFRTLKGAITAGVELETAEKRAELLTQRFAQLSGIQGVAAQSADKFRIAQSDTLAALIDLGNRLGPQGASLAEIRDVYDGFNTVLAINKVSTQEAASAQLQLNQALGSGRLAGEEFRAVNEATPQVIDAVAKILGVARGEVKQLAADGAVTAPVLIQALRDIKSKGADVLEASFDSASGRLRAFQKAQTELAQAIGIQLLPAFTPVISAVTDLIRKFAALPGPAQAVIAGVVGITTALIALAPVITGAIGLLKALGVATLVSAGPWVALAAGITAAAVALASYQTQAQKTAKGAATGDVAAIKKANDDLYVVNQKITKTVTARANATGRERASLDRQVQALRRDQAELQKGLTAGRKVTAAQDLTGGLDTGAVTGAEDAKASKAKKERESQLEAINAANGLFRSQQSLIARIANAEYDRDTAERLRLEMVKRGVELMHEAAAIQRDETLPADEKAAMLQGIRDKLAASTAQYNREIFEFQKQAIESLPGYLSSLQSMASGYGSVLDYSKRLTKEQEQQKLLAEGISNVVGQNMVTAFDALIAGTESFGNSLRKIASGVLIDIARQLLQIYVINQAINSISSLFGPKTTGLLPSVKFNPSAFSMPQLAGARAMGGSVSAGSSYLVGERGPELFTPGRSGGIAPSGSFGGVGNVTVNVDASGSNVEGNADQANQLGKAIGLAVQQELIKQKRPGGLLA